MLPGKGSDFATLFGAWAAGENGGAMGTAVEAIGRAIANAHLLIDLDAVVLIGGITAIGEPFRSAVERAFKEACPGGFREDLAIRLGRLGQFAGAVGAASLWRGEAA